MSAWPARANSLRTRVRPLMPVLRVVGFIAAVALVIAMAVGAANDVELSQLTWWPLPVALVLTAFWWLLLARGWALLVTGSPTRQDVSVWCRTQALRYLPGGLWAPVSRGVILDGKPLDRLSTVAAENVLALCAALAIGGLALAASGRPAWGLLVLLAAAPLVATRWTGERTRLSPVRVRRAGIEYVIGFVAYELAAAFDQAAVSGWHAPLAMAGAAGIAWGAGLVVVIAPSGIGVRELVYVELLSGKLPHAELVAGALTLRVVTILAELAMLVVVGRPPRRKP